MSDDTTNTAQAGELGAPATIDRDADLANMRRVATIHFVEVMAALTLWGASDAWAVSSGWTLAWAVAMANAVIAGFVIASILHEWGHFAGARLSGAVSPVLKKPVRYFFMFNFSFDDNDERQFFWMSLGGIVMPWLLVLLTGMLIPIDNASRAMLLAVFVALAVQVSFFEVPVVVRASRGGDPQTELGRQLKGGLEAGRYLGIVVGALVWLSV
jgi:hypothetical protein